MKIQVVGYNEKWPLLFRQEAEKIKKILGAELIDIHHIGSTSVKNLSAKPIIDIMPVVKDIALVDSYQKEFETLGYEAMGEFGIAGRRYFRKGLEFRTHHVHVFEESNLKDIERHLAVRDYLREHPQDAVFAGPYPL